MRPKPLGALKLNSIQTASVQQYAPGNKIMRILAQKRTLKTTAPACPFSAQIFAKSSEWEIFTGIHPKTP